MLKVSIIVAIYNIKEYLQKCIDSIIAQTYRELEIILVDDGSTDGCATICDDYARKDSRIIVLHKKNAGLVSARKAGIERASGDYVLQVDGDDWLEDTLIEKLVLETDEESIDMICTGHYIQYGDNSSLIINKMSAGIYENTDLVSDVLFTGVFYEFGINPYVWTKFVRTTLAKKAINDVDNAVAIGEDVVFMLSILNYVRKVKIAETAGIHYVQRSSSMLRKESRDEEIRCKALMKNLLFVVNKMGKKQQLYGILNKYCKLICAFRLLSMFDDSMSNPLRIMGGIDNNSKVVIYGAGSLGQAVYRYCSLIPECDIVDWLDMDYQNLRQINMPVNNPLAFNYKYIDVDYYIIGCGSYKTKRSIENFLILNGVEPDRVRWLTEQYLSERYDLLAEFIE